MEQQQQSNKVTLRLVQPDIMCEGRKRVTCLYTGKIVGKSGLFTEIQFKSRGKLITVIFLQQDCITDGWHDLKINRRL